MNPAATSQNDHRPPQASYRGNPEFRRNLWLEFSTQRLILMPALITFILIIDIAFQKYRGEHGVIMQNITAHCFLGVLGLLFWSVKQAADTLAQEAREGTWDNQRMSGLTPWQMVWGKLLGGTLYTWYGCVILMFIGALGRAGADMSLRQIALFVVGAVALGVLLQSASMLRVLLAWRRKGATRSGFANFFFYLFLCAVICALFFFFWVLEERGTLEWWGGTWPIMDFSILCLVCLAFWSVLGLWLAMRQELLEKSRGSLWWWAAFLVFWCVWVWGLIRNQPENVRWYCFAPCVLLVWASAYLQLILAPKDRMAWRRLCVALARRDSRQIQCLWPLWTISIALALLLSVAAVVLAPPSEKAARFFVSVTCFVVRDFAWVFWLHLAQDNRRAEGAMIASFAVAYLVLPFMAHDLFFPGVDIPNFFFYILQAAGALVLLFLRWRKVFAQPALS
jgi:hypothetical protein